MGSERRLRRRVEGSCMKGHRPARSGYRLLRVAFGRARAGRPGRAAVQCAGPSAATRLNSAGVAILGGSPRPDLGLGEVPAERCTSNWQLL
jgi:hypothetical protein